MRFRGLAWWGPCAGVAGVVVAFSGRRWSGGVGRGRTRCRRRGIPRLTGGLERVRAGGVSVMCAWAAQGLGISLLPEFVVSASLRSGTLARLGLFAPDLSLRLVWRGDREDLPGLRDVLYAASELRWDSGRSSAG
ncbi:LysR substrate-binding domain-containing protein [Nonomuraea sp. NPDC046570]|uniref:LysR substrate-binding domain-containing protein n=1 Tax=Nonomuraea sp. NPDC046570 TaxID=3155255 RepID=UPI0033E9A2FC